MTFHSEFRKGQKVLVILTNGEYYIDKYVGVRSKFIDCEKRSFNKATIRAVSIYKKPTDKLNEGVF